MSTVNITSYDRENQRNQLYLPSALHAVDTDSTGNSAEAIVDEVEDVTFSDDTADESPKTADIRVVSYNVLSSSLCEAGYHTKCTRENLNPATRLQRVKDLLRPEMEAGSVVCLQEVSMRWASRLHEFFLANGYVFIHHGYGGNFDGYMGAGIAFPQRKFELRSTRIERLADTKYWPKRPREAPPTTLQRLAQFWHEAWHGTGPPPPPDPWKDAKRRQNFLVYMRLEHLESPGLTFAVATYHMPCQFRIPAVMVIHAALALQMVQKLARDDPLIFCGDMNFKPGDSPYRLVTEGSLSSEDEFYPQPPEDDRWRPVVDYPMRSAYKATA
ncbi:hypothetical protein CYMTET_25197 [Cymbomonas tetramitiformis]|uniref:Endonuclease/exonuclease/phosphatase domain-containing protein n=1 Tax=Cymbomonas tetramitiformis TaxID=36881 RepID=A0AAE0FUB4_9CHLO|nr:hypothetical protein CYMTET_25197 [Cymbomonas tetramitiformis]